MPPASSPGSHDRHGAPASGLLDRAAKVRFRRAVTLMLMTLVLPGSAQLVAGRRDLGRIAIRIYLSLIAVAGLALVTSLFWHGFAYWVATNTTVLGLIRWGMMAAAIGWAYLFVDAWRIGQPLTLIRQQRLAVVSINGFLTFTVAGALLFASHIVGVQRDLMESMFGDGKVTGSHEGRYNVLLMGGDSGAGRWGLRPDSMTVASIDAETGKTVLIGLPRNLENFTFAEGSVMDRKFPKGFNCDGCYLNGVSTWAEDHKELFKGSKQPGIDATIMAIEGITGLKINYWAMVNLAGFKELVDAVGGVELNVRDRIPVGGLGSDVTGYIEPGQRTLNGHDALWFARAREGSDDYSRMARQKCVMNAMLTQLSPQTVLSNYQDIASAGEAMVETNLPAKEVSRFVQLAEKAKDNKVATVSIVPPFINTAEPDLAKIKKMVGTAIDRSEGDAPPPAKKKASNQPPSQTGGSLGTRNQGYLANESNDLGAAC